MTTAIIHIGVAKTGTTALQHALSFNSRKLAEAGIDYPRLSGITHRHGLIDHNRLAYALFDGRSTANLELVQKELKVLARSGRRLLLSAEVFYMRPLKTKFHNLANYLTEKRTAIAKLIDILNPFSQVQIVCYVRRQDMWLESVYNEWVKQGKTQEETFEAFLKNIVNDDFSGQLDMWSGAVGRENVIVRPYEKGQLVNGDIVADFSAVLGLPDSLQFAPRNISTVNPRLTRDALEFRKILWRLKLEQGERRIWQNALWKVSEELQSANPEPAGWQSFLNRDQRLILLDSYAEANRDVACNYLGRKSGVLFYEPVVEDGETYPGLAVGRTIEIYMRLKEEISWPVMQQHIWVRRIRIWLRDYLPFLRPLLSPLGRWHQRISARRYFGYE